MFSVVDPGIYPQIRALYTTVYALWAALWTIVAFYYGRAAYASWLAAGGGLLKTIPDIMAPFWWALKETGIHWRFLKGVELVEGDVIPSRHESGHLLRFAIFLGSLTPIVFGINFIDLDRANWTYFRLATTMMFAGTSILAAGGHLFLAYRAYPSSWRKLVFRCLMWLIFAPIALFYFYAWRAIK